MAKRKTPNNVNYREMYDKLYLKGYHKNDERGHYPTFFDWVYAPSKINKDVNTILDCGCSYGYGLNLINRHFEKEPQNLYGIDPSPTAIEGAKKKYSNFNFSVMSLPSLSFPDDHFDLVMSAEVIEHLLPKDQGPAWEEMFRVSKKYVAHMISNTPEGDNKWGPQHFTCWSGKKWWNYLKGKLPKGWKIKYWLDEPTWNSIQEKRLKGEGFTRAKRNDKWKNWEEHMTCAVFEKEMES